MSTDAFRAERIAWQFRRSCQNDDGARPYLEWSIAQQREIADRLQIRTEQGEIVAVAWLVDAQWGALTSRRLIVNSEQSLPLADIVATEIDFDALSRAGKSAICSLQVKLKGGGVVSVDVRAGAAYWAILSILKHPLVVESP